MTGYSPLWEHKIPILNLQHQDCSEQEENYFTSNFFANTASNLF